ncbi:MAG: hypothetical protein AB1758_26480 [Candidatus Eremiobacterota bacterium]
MKRQGVVLIMVLLGFVLLLLLGMGLLGSQAARYRAATRAAEASQARQMAIFGLEDARLKLERDVAFPPDSSLGQTSFSYSEDVTLPDGSPASYSVVVELAFNRPPWMAYRVTSTGAVGPRDRPVTVHTINAEMSTDPGSTRCFKWLRWEDQGSL